MKLRNEKFIFSFKEKDVSENQIGGLYFKDRF